MEEYKKFENYWNKSENINCIGNSLNDFNKFFSKDFKIVDFSGNDPDLLLISHKKTLMLEYITIDASRTKSYSSLEKKESAKINREIDKENTSIKNGESKTISKEMVTEKNISAYEKNLNRIFDDHIKNYDRYLENVKNYCAQNNLPDLIEFGLIIEDTSLLPNIMIKSNFVKYLLTPFFIESFKQRLKEYKFIKHVLFFCDYDKKNKIIYYNNASNHSLSEFKIDSSDVLIDFKTNVISSVSFF